MIIEDHVEDDDRDDDDDGNIVTEVQTKTANRLGTGTGGYL